MSSLDIPERQILLRFPEDPVPWYHRILMLPLSGASWVVATPDLVLQIEDLAGQRVRALARNVDFPTGIAGKKYRDGMCCEKTPTTCATRSPHVKACLMCNRYYDWATDAADECKWDKCVLAVSAGRAVELAEAHPPP